MWRSDKLGFGLNWLFADAGVGISRNFGTIFVLTAMLAMVDTLPPDGADIGDILMAVRILS
ncbi:hypothetical protein BMW24_013375 [Mycobacterium heckeshornense]|nr:hypothetical protein BMW24_013375 [Mycobacterium heckeshornense]